MSKVKVAIALGVISYILFGVSFYYGLDFEESKYFLFGILFSFFAGMYFSISEIVADRRGNKEMERNFERTRLQAMANEKVRIAKEKEESEKLKIAGEISKMEGFKKSGDFKLLLKFVEKYPNHNDYREYNTLREIILSRKDITVENINSLIVSERKIYWKNKLRRQMRESNSIFYKDYLSNLIELYGDKAKEMSGTLTEILVEDRGLQVSKEKVLDDLLDFEIVLKRKALEHSLNSNEKATTMADVDRLSPLEFEKLIANIYRLKGYVATTTRASGDQGADVILEKLGSKIVIQAKLYSAPVGNKAVQEVVAAKYHYGASRAIVITNNYFTSSAKDLARSNQVELIDRPILNKMI